MWTMLGILLALAITAQGRLVVDFSEIQNLDTKQKAEQYQAASTFDIHSTATFKLRMSPEAMATLGLTEQSFAGHSSLLADPVRRLAFAEAALQNVSTNLLPEGQELLHSMVIGPLQTAIVTLKPTDDQLQELLNFLDAYKAFWGVIGTETVPQVENLQNDSLPLEVEEIIQQFYKEGQKKSENNRRARALSPMKVSKSNLEHLFTTVFNVPRNIVADVQNYTAVRTFVRETFESLGLVVTEHQFATYETDFLYGEQLMGTNVVAMLPGTRWGTSADLPVVVGAHMDTVEGSPGMDDNGSGMAAMLETARILTTAGCAFDNTIVFVAFDLEEIGTHGSMMFVKDFVPRVLRELLGTQRPAGALIMDCIANWDPKPNTQSFPESYREYLPRFVARVESSDHAGDFLSVIFRDGVDGFLARRFASYYSRLSDPQYRLELLGVEGLGPSMPDPLTLQKHFDVMRSDHARFWYPSEGDNLNQTIPAVLITDMGPYRGRLRECYHRPCDVHVPGEEVDLGLLAKTTEAVAWTAADLAGGQCGPRGRLGVRQFFRILSGFLSDDELLNNDESTSDVNQNNKDQTENLDTNSVQNDPNLLRQASSTDTPADSGVSSVTNALEMLHFLGVVPSIEQLTESQLQSPRRRGNRILLNRGRSLEAGRRQSRFRGHSSTADDSSRLIITDAERRGL